MERIRRPSLVLLPLLAATLLGGCGKDKLHLPVVENQRPELRLTQAPASTTIPYFYSYEVFWTAFDPDGRVDHFLYCVDPPAAAGSDTPWVTTHDNRVTLLLKSGDADSLGTKTNPGGFHIFVIKAVDDRGLPSAPVSQSFFSFTVAPTVQFIQPKANHLLFPMLPPLTSFTFTGTDPDGQTHKKPIYYRWKLFPEDGREFDFLTAVAHPDSLRRHYAPNFFGWDSIAGDTCRVRVQGLIPDKKYVMVVVSFDEAGAYSPDFNLDGNMCYFLCQYTGRQGPRLSVWNDFFSYTYQSGGYNPDPSNWINIEVPYQQKIQFNWSGVAQPGATVKSYRWAMDIARLDDDTPRTNEQTDITHWSFPTGVTTTASVGPFTGGISADSLEQHLFYIEAQDDNGLKSLAIVQFRVIRPIYSRDLLFVDDTRLNPDLASPVRADSVLAPSGIWPDAAELDTFLFAVGGVRWRYYVPPTQQSRPGIFAGYSFDTVGTRGLTSGTLPLALLAKYRHVVWYCDQAANYTQAPGYQFGMPSLRWISAPGQNNVLGLYSRLGGNLWLFGGGVAYNSLVPYNLTSNDGGGATFSASTGELVNGRLMYSIAHWRSEIVVKAPKIAVLNDALAPAWPGAPDYGQLPAQLLARTSTSDPVPPERGAGTFYTSSYTGEILDQANVVSENTGPDPDHPIMGPTLDTLYFALNGNVPQPLPVMTYYHGAECGPVVFSGFAPWYFQRANFIQLADFVLQGIWGLPRQPKPR